MLAVTEGAREALKTILDSTETQPEQSLRLVEEEGKYQLTLDAEQEGDQVVEHEGETVLLIDQEVRTELETVVLDLQDSPEGPQLAFVPKEEGSQPQ